MSRLHILGIVPSVDLASFYEVVVCDVAATLAGQKIFAPQCLGATLRAKTLLLCRVAASSFGILCVNCAACQVASFNIAVASFGCPTFTSLNHVGSHDYAFDFPHNLRFSYCVPRLEGRNFNFP